MLPRLRLLAVALLLLAPVSRADFAIVDPDEQLKPDPARPKPARKYETFAHHVLDLDSEEAPASPAKYALLDAIIDDAKSRITYDATLKDPAARRKQAEHVLEGIDQVLTDHNVLFPAGDYDVESLRAGLAPQTYDAKALDEILAVPVNARRRDHARKHAAKPFYILDCDTSSFVYLAIAQAIGFDLHLVDLPDHMFVRWELGDGRHLNWDTNDAEVVSDKEYAADYGMKKRLRKDRVYLASMTPREAEGFAYFLRSGRYEDRGEDAKAMADLEKARELYPQATQVAAELAWLYATAEGVDAARKKQALPLAQSAVDAEPKCGDFWDSLAAAHAAGGDFKEAARCAEKAEHFADSREQRAEFKSHRKSYERKEMPRPTRTPSPASKEIKPAPATGKLPAAPAGQ